LGDAVKQKEKVMRVDLNASLVDLEGVPITIANNSQAIATLRFACEIALKDDLPGERSDGKARYARYELLQKIHGAGEADLTAEEISLLKSRTGQRFTNAVIVGRCWDLLEGKAA